MHFYAVLAFVLIISKLQYVNVSHEMFMPCFHTKDGHLFVAENSSFVLDLSLQQHGFNCTMEFTSHSSKLNFQFNSLNLPFDNETKTCLDFVTVSNFYLTENQTRAMCRKSDLPANGLIVTTNPGVVSLSNRCSSRKCNYSTSSGFKIIITPNFENASYSNSTDNHNLTWNFNSEKSDVEDYIIISACGIAILLILAACYVGRKYCRSCKYSRKYTIGNDTGTSDIIIPEPLPPIHASGRDNEGFEIRIKLDYAETAV